jgi:hypothetical protein
MPDSVEVIAGSMFSGCASLASLPLPKSVSITGSGGGKIFYYSKAGFTMTDNNQVCHCLEAALNDMPADLAWASRGYWSTDIPGTGLDIGTGRKNTAIILATDANAPAAKACMEYCNGGKTDWFLPSRDELYMLYASRDFVVNTGTGWDWGWWYWSSSQYTFYQFIEAWQQSFRGSDGSQTSYKVSRNFVRAVRAF